MLQGLIKPQLIKQIREALRLSQRQLSKYCGVSRGVPSKAQVN